VLAIFLTTERQFDPSQVGIALGVGNIAGILAQTPIGAIVNVTKRKRLTIAIATSTIESRVPIMAAGVSRTITLRAFIYGLNANPWFALVVQTLDGLASGILAVSIAIVVADLTKGTGHFNLAQGGIYTTIGVGAALSNLAIGFLAKTTGSKICELLVLFLNH
jgi:MFS family permease